MMVDEFNKKTEEYYDRHQALYNLFWSKNALHYGFWEKDTKCLPDAIENTNKFVAKLLDVKKEYYVLDAGCGVGGSSIFMAKKHGCRVVGITLSSKQIKQARKSAKRQGADNLVKFAIMDFNKTGLDEGVFSRIFGVESICHANNKLNFLKEAYRILTDGGKIVIVDGFRLKKRLSKKEKTIYDKCLTGWKVANLSHKDDFYEYLMSAGFHKIKFYDKTNNVIKSSKRIAFYGYLVYPISFILSKLRILPKDVHENTICMINQRKTFHNFTVYGVFVAEK